MTQSQQSTSRVRKGKQWATLVSNVSAQWKTIPPEPRPLSAARGSVSFPSSGTSISYESALERDFLLFCRTDHRVAAVHAQQLVIRYMDLRRGVQRRYTPDFLVEIDEAAGLPWRRAVVEVKTRQDVWRSRRLMRASYAAARLWAREQDHTIYRVVTDEMMTGEWLANTRLLSGSLDKPFDLAFERECAAVLSARDTYRIGEALKLAQQRGLNPDLVLPVLYRMVVRGELSIDRGQPIRSGTWVTVVGTQKRL